MTKITHALVESAMILAVGLTIVGGLMFAFAQNAHAASDSSRIYGTKLEVSIADTGKVLVRGAEVTAVSDTTITARTSWGDTGLTWTIRTDADTDVIQKNGSASNLDELAVGDTVSFSGTIDRSEAAFTVDADVVKNWSQEQDFAVFTGVVTSVDEDDGSFVIRTNKDATVTVETNGDTAYAASRSFADVDVNDKIVVSGSYDAEAETLAATKISLDMRAAIKPILKDRFEDWKNFPIFKWFGGKNHDNR